MKFNMTASLGRLQRVEVREVWSSESSDFTPWLAREDNIALLSEAIGLELEVEAQEKNVGPFRADILCKDTASGNWVLIENQLEKTDHAHLGQLLTYASGLSAVTIVWIAHRFSDEHRAALDWLNEVTNEEINFFGLEIELWRIGESAIAPKFNVISQPNDWTKVASAERKAASAMSDRPNKTLQVEFWTAFRDYIRSHGATFKPTKPLPQRWMNVSIGRTGFRLVAIASLYDTISGNYHQHELRAELALTDENSKDYYAQLHAMKSEVEREFGGPLVWYNPENKKTCRISVRVPTDLHERSQWPQYCEWLKVQLDALRRVFADRVKTLEPTGLP